MLSISGASGCELPCDGTTHELCMRKPMLKYMHASWLDVHVSMGAGAQDAH